MQARQQDGTQKPSEDLVIPPPEPRTQHVRGGFGRCHVRRPLFLPLTSFRLSPVGPIMSGYIDADHCMFVPGQRWISTAEPELGLGTVLRVDERHVQVLFAKSGVLRPYAQASAPLTRAEFRPGQRVAGKGFSFLVESVDIHDGLLVYHGESRQLDEGQLDDEQSVSQADDRLIAGRIDSASRFELRLETMRRRAQAWQSPAWGLASARIDLIAHQLRVASIATSRRPPRVLLADEVGLGKTIEAGMLIARQLATGRASRVLVLVPDALINQWFVELLRRFNLAFAIFDEERCTAIKQSTPDVNPFEEEQLIIAGFSLVEGNDERITSLLEATWDLLVVDEAHHLEWTPQWSSPRYTLVEQLATQTPAVALVTATPEQLGRRGHFARLRLLDPSRYTDLDAHLAEADGYAALADIAEALADGQTLNPEQRERLRQKFRDDAALLAQVDGPAPTLLRSLIDRHGPGRVMFRNRRAGVGGFAQRHLDLQIVPADNASDELKQALLAEFCSDMDAGSGDDISHDYTRDPRLSALLELMAAQPDAKVLLICTSQAKVLAIEEALRTTSGIAAARFHEGMGLLQRDRNAAYFAQADGARLLLCSEIGSEGRNFQFAHHLFLWDLPHDPDLLEQRIGRLDRIGQSQDVLIHVAVVADSAQHVLARWYQEGLDAFVSPPSDGRELLRQFGETIVQQAIEHARGTSASAQPLQVLLAETQAAHAQLSEQIQAGRDRLLELASLHEPQAEALHTALIDSDQTQALEDYVPRLLNAFGIAIETLENGSVILDPEYLATDALPGLGDGPRQATFSRSLALAREDLALLRTDHPLIATAMDLLLAGETGNSAFMIDEALPPRTAILQAVFVLECVTDRKLDVARFLPPLPLVTSVDSRLVPRPTFMPSDSAVQRAGVGRLNVHRYRKIFAKLVPPLLERAQVLTQEKVGGEIDKALQAARTTIEGQCERLRNLHAINPAVNMDQVQLLESELATLERDIPRARLRLDALRFVASTDFLRLR